MTQAIDAPPTLDVSALPTFAFGRRSVLWWGTVLLMLIEGTLLAILFASYIYVQGNFQAWPPSGRIPLAPGIAFQGVLLVSCVTAWLMRNAAIRMDLRASRRWLLATAVLSLVAAAARGWTFVALPFTWDENAYASIVWTSMGTHATELAAGIGENALMLALLFKGPLEKKHFEDLEVGAYFWLFAALVWLPFALLFLIDGGLR